METTREERDDWRFFNEAMPTDRCADISVDECLRLINDADRLAAVERSVRELTESAGWNERYATDPVATSVHEGYHRKLRAILDPEAK